MVETNFYSDGYYILVLHHKYMKLTWGLERGALPPWILRLLAKKGCFFNFEGLKRNFTTFGPPWKKFWENPLLAPPGKNPSDAHGS